MITQHGLCELKHRFVFGFFEGLFGSRDIDGACRVGDMGYRRIV
jgi:hypothetical protein